MCQNCGQKPDKFPTITQQKKEKFAISASLSAFTPEMMGLWCRVKCQSSSEAVLIVQLRDHQSSPGRCIVTVKVLTCFINQSYWIASCYFYSQWHDLPARGLTSWCACIDLMLWGGEQSEGPTIIFFPPWNTLIHEHTNTHTHMVVHYAHPHTLQYSGMVYSFSCIFLEAQILNSDTPLSLAF